MQAAMASFLPPHCIHLGRGVVENNHSTVSRVRTSV